MIYFSLGILILILGMSLFTRRLFYNPLSLRAGNNLPANGLSRRRWQAGEKIYKYTFILTIILIFIVLLFQSYQQYQLWLKNDISKHLLPPYQNINYFIFYSLTRFFGPYLISFGAGLIFLLLAKILNKKYDERFFYPEEYYLGGISIFLTGHPGWLFYAVFLLIAYLLIHFYSLFIISRQSPKSERLSLYYLWLPMAIFVIIIGKWLQYFPIWQILKF